MEIQNYISFNSTRTKIEKNYIDISLLSHLYLGKHILRYHDHFSHIFSM